MKKSHKIHVIIILFLLLVATNNSFAQDSDNDGIVDNTDLDDDNDGVVDVVECGCTSLNTFGNGSFESPTVPFNNGWNTLLPQASVPNWKTTATDGLIEFWPTSGNGGNAAQGSQFVELNATQASTLYQVFCIRGGGGTVSWSVRHRGRNGVDVAEVRIGTSLTNYTTVQTMSDGATTWGSYSGVYNVASGISELYVMFSAISSSGGGTTVGNFLDNVQITVTTNCADTDNDGITNDKDLDSDNDGCSDAFEAGATTNGTPNFQFSSSTVGTNGLSSLVENNDSPSATTTYTSTYNQAINAGIMTCCVSVPPDLSTSILLNVCPTATVNLNNLHSGAIPSGLTLVWFNNNAHTGAAISTATAISNWGTYYAFYYDAANTCYSPASEAVMVTIVPCGSLTAVTAPTACGCSNGISSIDCIGATHNGTLTQGTAASGVSSSIPYSGGNGSPHNGQVVSSTGVTGLTATLAAGNFANGGGSLIYSITGTPASAGTATFALSISGQVCNLTRTVTLMAGTVTTFNCAAATPSPAGYNSNGTAYTGTATLSYTGGNSGSYAAGSVASTGVTGFTATWAAGTLASGAGTITINITGSSSTAGNATFPITIAGKSCSITLSGCGAFVAAGQWKAFLCHNLGANPSLDPHVPDVGLQGGYVQWGRRGPNITGDSRVDWQTAGNTSHFAAPPTASNPNNALISGWNTTAAASNAWLTTGGAKTADDPCPTGYRVPTSAEWTGVNSNNTVSATGTWTSSNTNYSAALHYGPNSITKRLTLPAAGLRGASSGSLLSRGINGFYGSSTETGTGLVYYMSFSVNTFNAIGVVPSNTNAYTTGFSIRCIAE